MAYDRAIKAKLTFNSAKAKQVEAAGLRFECQLTKIFSNRTV